MAWKKVPTFIIEPNITIPTNQATILTWKKKDHVALAAIWNCIDNSIFSHVGAWKIAFEAWLALENTYSSSDVVTLVHMQEKFIIQK